ncbi:MAG: hypothetical protein HKN47_23480, partial [Pirellulaceae bacterium]|nr:hypothetical protein [Pirellulaceae bacterium]
MSRFLKRKIGIAFWATAFVVMALGVKPLRKATTKDGDVSLMKYFSGPTQRVFVDDQSMASELHDPVFYEDPSGKWRQIGYVSQLGDPDTDPGQVEISWYSSKISPAQCELFQYRSTGSLKEVLATMLPPEKQLRIQQRLSAALSEHGDDLSQAFVPLVQQSLKKSMPVIEAEFRKTIDRHREEINQLATRFNDEVVEQQLIPLAKEEIMPIVRKHGQPPAEEIGREIWDRASLWRFGWRAVYDKTPLPEKGLVQEEWKRFVESEAVPVIEEKMDDIVIAVQRIFSDVAVNPTIRAEIAGVADELAKDPEVTALVRKILRETLVENDR